MNLLSKSLKLQPGLHVLTGPVNSGKSLVVKKLSQSFEAAHVPVMSINLREISCNSVDSFVFTLQKATNSWLDKFTEAAEHFKLDTEAYGFKIKIELQQSRYSSPLTRLGQLLIEKLPPYTFWWGSKPPVLIIDKGNELRAMLKDQYGEDALHNFFKWLVLNTKELRRFHALFASSDSFFHLWLAKFIGTTRYESYVIGNLTKDDAKVYWEQKASQMELHFSSNKIVPPRADFEVIYAMCGGNMFLIEKALEFCFKCYLLDQPVNWENFPFFIQELNKLTKAYFPSSSKFHSHEIGKSEPQWNGNHLLRVMEELVESPPGISYFHLCNTLGKPIIDSLIEHNVIHLRPTSQCCFDIKKGDIVTAESPCGLNAMKHMVKMIKSRNPIK